MKPAYFDKSWAILPIVLVYVFSTVSALAQTASNVSNEPKESIVVAKETEKPKPVSPVAPKPVPPTPIKLGPVTFSGSIRGRFESWNWFDTNAADDQYNFGAVTARLALSQNKEKFEWMVECAAPVLIKTPTRSIAPAPQGQLGLGANYFAANGQQDATVILKQGFARFKGLFGDSKSSLKIGRFEFNDGTEVAPADASLAALKRDRISQRLIGTFGFTHIGRSFDGLQYGRQGKSTNLTLLAARPTTGVFDLDANKEMNVDLWYGALTKSLKYKTGESEYRLFALHYRDWRNVLKTDNRALALRNTDFENIGVTTVGGHYIGTYKTGGGKADLLLWGVGQFGDWGRQSHRAGAIAVEGGYQIGGEIGAKIKPWIRAGYFRSTGDGDPSDNKHTTFFQVLPTPRIYARMPFFNLMNNEDTFAEILLKPHSKLAMRADVHHLRLSNTRDFWYSGGGAFQRQTFGYVGRPSNGQRTLGTLFDLSVDYTIAARTTVTFYVSKVRGGGVVSKIYPLGRNAVFSYLELTQRF